MTKQAPYAVAYRVEDGQPWIGLPGVATEGSDSDTMFKNAKLAGWNVTKREIVTDARTSSPDFEIVRTNPEDGLFDRLHVSKTRYSVLQNEDLLTFAKNIPHGDLSPVAMGQLNDGRQVFMAFAMGESVTIAGTDDEVQHYLNAFTSHDGSWALAVALGNMRMQCQNMIRSIRSNALATFKARHTDTLEGRMEDARAALGVAVRQNQQVEQDMALLATQEVTENKFWELVKDIYPEPEKDVRGSKAKWEEKTSTIMGIWHGDTLANLDNTAYKAYNAFNEHLFWYSTVRDGNIENALSRASGFDELTVKKDVEIYKRIAALS